MQKAFCVKCNKKGKKNVTFHHVIKNEKIYCEYGHEMAVKKSFPWYFPNVSLPYYKSLKLPIHHNFICNCVTCQTNDRNNVKFNFINYCNLCLKEHGGIYF